MNENREETHLGMQLESQQNKKAKSSYRSVCLTLVAVLIIAIICMTGCKRRTNDDESTTSSEPEVTEEVEVTEEPEVTEEVEVTEETEVTEEPTGPQNVSEWAKSFEEGEGMVTIWNETTKEGIVVEEEGEYVLHEGDQLVIRAGTYNFSTSIQLDIAISNIYYVSATVLETFTEPTVVNIGIENEEGYSICFFLVSEGYESDMPEGSETTDTPEEDDTEMTEGERWVTSLDYDEPKLVFWNDELGVQTVVEEGESYQMNDGDVMAMYLPDGCYLSMANVNYVDMNLESKDGYSIIDYSTLGQNTNIELQIMVVLADAEMIFPIYYITTP